MCLAQRGFRSTRFRSCLLSSQLSFDLFCIVDRLDQIHRNSAAFTAENRSFVGEHRATTRDHSWAVASGRLLTPLVPTSYGVLSG